MTNSSVGGWESLARNAQGLPIFETRLVHVEEICASNSEDIAEIRGDIAEIKNMLCSLCSQKEKSRESNEERR
jgi:hypothetical protein